MTEKSFEQYLQHSEGERKNVNDESNNEELTRNVESYHQAAKTGDPEAQYQYGRCFEQGCGVEKDMEEALFWFTRAANRGHARACICLGKYIQSESGDSVSQDAEKWFRMGAETGNAEAQYAYGEFLEKNAGVSVGKQTAEQWFRLAAENGHTGAKQKLSE